jgi:branched-chain amino acid transport system ATP-binding protein
MTAPLLQTTALRKTYGGVEAVRSVDFSMADGELRCLIGPNGAGKSTFFKMLTGMVPPTTGTILLRGSDITGLQAHQVARLGIGVKTQVPSVLNGLTVHENLWIAAARHGSGSAAKRAIAEQIEWLNLGDISSKIVGQLAHGQRQWVELGMVLCGNPQVVLLDEPTAGMTEEETIRYSEMILEINRTRSVIVVEHDMHFIKSIAKRVTVFNQGTILKEGSAEEVFKDPTVRDVYLGHRREHHVSG